MSLVLFTGLLPLRSAETELTSQPNNKMTENFIFLPVKSAKLWLALLVSASTCFKYIEIMYCSRKVDNALVDVNIFFFAFFFFWQRITSLLSQILYDITVRPNLAEPYLVDPHLVEIVSKFPVWSTVLFGRHLFGRLNYLVDSSLVDYL